MKRHTHAAYSIMHAAYPLWASQYDAERAENWAKLLEDIPPEPLCVAINRLVRMSKFPPSIAEIYAEAGLTPKPRQEDLINLDGVEFYS